MSQRGITIRINGKEVENSIKSIAKESRILTAQLAKMEIGSDEYNKTVKELRGTKKIIRDHNNEIRGTTKSWKSAQGGITSAAKKIGAAAIAAFAVGGVVQFGRELFNTAARMEIMAAKAETVFGEALPKVTAAAKTSAAAMGLTEAAFIANTAALGDLLIPMGFTRDRAADISLELVNLGGALSEWTGGQFSAQQATEAMGKALLGERESLKTFGISILESDVSARLLEKGLNGLTGEMREQAKAAATLEIILEKSVDAQNAYADGAGTMVRRSAELQARFSEVYEQLATLLIPVFEELVEIAGGVATGLEVLSGAVQGLINPADSASKAFDKQSQRVKTLETDLVPLLDRYDELKKKGKLSADEQEEMNKLLASVSDIMPSAINSVDKYGRALGISTEAAREFIEEEKSRLAFVNADAIAKTEKTIEQLERQTAGQVAATQALREWKREGVLRRSNNPFAAFTEEGSLVAITEDEIIESQARTDKIVDQLKGAKLELDRLRGTVRSPLTPDTGTEDNGGKKPTGLTQKEIDAAAKAAEKLRDQRAKDLQKLRDLEREGAQQRFEDTLEDDAKKLEQIARSYDKRLALAKELEAQGVTEAKDLRLSIERQKDAELAAYRAEVEEKRFQKLIESADADLDLLDEQLSREMDAIEKSYEDKEKLKRDLFEASQETGDIAQGGLTDEERLENEINRALAESNALYDVYITQAKELGIDLERIEEDRQARLLAIQKQGAEEQKKLAKDVAIARLREQEQTFQQLGSAFGTIADSIAAKTEQGLVFKKAATLAQIAFDTAAAIAGATAQAQSVPFPGNIAAIAAGVASVVSSISQAKAALAQGTVPQYFEGGATGNMRTVTGAQDGRTYNARYIGRPSTGLLPSGPHLALLNERGPEYVVSNDLMRNPYVVDHIRAIEAFKGGRVRQYMDGGATGAVASGSTSSTVVQNQSSEDTNALLAQNIQVLTLLYEAIDGGILAVIEDDAAIALRSRLDAIDRVAGERVG